MSDASRTSRQQMALVLEFTDGTWQLFDDAAIVDGGVREYFHNGEGWRFYPWHRIESVTKPATQPSGGSQEVRGDPTDADRIGG